MDRKLYTEFEAGVVAENGDVERGISDDVDAKQLHLEDVVVGDELGPAIHQVENAVDFVELDGPRCRCRLRFQMQPELASKM